MPPVAVKFGMLAGAETIKAVARFFAGLKEKPFLVLDPVMVSTSGHSLLDEDAHAALLDLIKLVDLVTPNIPEALTLLGKKGEIKTQEDMTSLAKELSTGIGAKAILLKGGHLALPAQEQDTIAVIQDFRKTINLPKLENVVVDIFVSGATEPHFYTNPRIESSSTHGTGCTLSAALAAVYAQNPGAELATSVSTAITYTQGAIAAAFPLGSGHGPTNHGYLTVPRLLPLPTATHPTPFLSHLIGACPDLWEQYVKHPFVIQLGEGTLPRDSFKHYITQDYHYLRHCGCVISQLTADARAHALAAYKSSEFSRITAFSEIALHIAKESEMHVGVGCGGSF